MVTRIRELRRFAQGLPLALSPGVLRQVTCGVPVAMLLAAAEVSGQPLPRARPVPDYDGRPEPGASVGEILRWGPRLLLSPLLVASELALRRPLGFVTTELERHDVPEILRDALTWQDRQAGIIPTFLLDFGINPSAGFYLFWNDAFAESNDLRLRFGFWGGEWIQASVRDTFSLSDALRLDLTVQGSRRPDWRFFGLGPMTLEANRARYGSSRLSGEVGLRWHVTPVVSARFSTQVRAARFDARRTCCGDPALADAPLLIPAGFSGGYEAHLAGASIAVDTRAPRPAPQDGFLAETHVSHGLDLEDPGELQWMVYGGSLGAFADLNGHQRVVSLVATVDLAEPLGRRPIPFTELPRLGGIESHMPGFPDERLIGESSLLVRLEYRWPVWAWSDGSIHLAVGNVFGPRFVGFAPDRLRLSMAVGLVSALTGGAAVDLYVAGGTETFEQGAAVSSLRFELGVTDAP